MTCNGISMKRRIYATSKKALTRYWHKIYKMETGLLQTDLLIQNWNMSLRISQGNKKGSSNFEFYRRTELEP